MNKKRAPLIILLILALLIIMFHSQIVDLLDEAFGPKDPRPTIATMESYEGNVNYKKPKTLRYRKVKNAIGLRDQDTLVTDENSRAILAFEGGYRLEVEPNSIVIIEEPQIGEDGTFRVTFLRGDYRVLDVGNVGRLLVAKDKNIEDAAGRPAPEKPILVSMKEPEKAPPPPPPKPIRSEVVEELKKEIKKTAPVVPAKKRETLPDDYIASIVKRQTPFFNRCYAEHLRLNPNAKGRINLSFTITPGGQVSSVRMLGSTLKDPRLEQCTMAVVERARFRTYEGDPIVVNYPINFE